MPIAPIIVINVRSTMGRTIYRYKPFKPFISLNFPTSRTWSESRVLLPWLTIKGTDFPELSVNWRAKLIGRSFDGTCAKYMINPCWNACLCLFKKKGLKLLAGCRSWTCDERSGTGLVQSEGKFHAPASLCQSMSNDWKELSRSTNLTWCFIGWREWKWV